MRPCLLGSMTDWSRRLLLARKVAAKSTRLTEICHRTSRTDYWQLPLRCPVYPLVDLGVAHDGLHILASFSERNGLDELLHVAEVARRAPILDAIGPRVISGQRVLSLSAEVVNHLPEVTGSQFNVRGRIEQGVGLVMLQAGFLGLALACLGQQLHQPISVGMGNGTGIELRFLPDQRRHQI